MSVDLAGLHMASDHDFNRKSFTTGHTGFSMPFTTWPDRSDVPRSAARPLRYLHRFVTVTQGEVFYITQALAELEGLERGPAGNTSLAAAVALAQQMPSDAIIVVQETEYTGAGKHPVAQLALARRMGVEIKRGEPGDSLPGRRIVIPNHPAQLTISEIDLDKLRRSYLGNAHRELTRLRETRPELSLRDADIAFLAADTGSAPGFVRKVMREFDEQRG